MMRRHLTVDPLIALALVAILVWGLSSFFPAVREAVAPEVYVEDVE